jgi:hypothetical protein
MLTVLIGNLQELKLSKFQGAFEHLTSRSPDQFWTSGQWMTERRGKGQKSVKPYLWFD